MELENCYYVPSITINIISVSSVDSKGFSFQFKDNSCSFALNGMCYGSAQQENGLYVLDTSKHIYNMNTKKAKIGDSNLTFLWHCRLGHINIKRMELLQRKGILESLDLEKIDQCESCLLGKITK